MSASRAFLGLDFGTSGARAVVIDGAGEVLAETRQPCTLDDPAAWRAALGDLIAALPAALRSRLAGVAVDGTSATVLPCGADNAPMAAPLPYHDARASREASELDAVAPSGHVVLTPSSSLAKLLWLERQGLARGARWLASQADWITSLLSGRPGLSDYHNALKLGYDPGALRFPPWVLGLPATTLLPAVLPPGAVVCPVESGIAAQLGLPPDCLVRAGTTDSVAAFIAARAVDPGTAVTSLGSTLALKLLSTRRVDSARHGIYSHRLGSLWLAGGASNSGGAVLRSFFDDAELERLSAEIDPACPTGLDYYPLPARGERFPVCDPELAPRMEPRPAEAARFLQALLEGMAHIEARGYRLLAELGATPLTRVLSAGGGAGNPAWQAIRVRCLGVPVGRAVHGEAAYGTALLAAGMLPGGDQPLG